VDSFDPGEYRSLGALTTRNLDRFAAVPDWNDAFQAVAPEDATGLVD
jgi:hypothetical protein